MEGAEAQGGAPAGAAMPGLSGRDLGVLSRRLGRGGPLGRTLYARTRRFALRRELARRRAALAALPPAADLAIAAERGFRLVPPGRLEAAAPVAEAAARVAAAAARPDGRPRKKQQLASGLVDAASLTRDSPFVRLALDPGLVAAVAHYLGAVPLLTTIDVWASHASAALANSQLYHCDWADLSQVKVFVHASDVTPADGPLVVLGADTSARLRRSLGYRWGGDGYRVADATVAQRVGAGDRHTLCGPAGSVALVDTCRCFHYGSRVAPEGSRAVCVLQYLLPSAFSLPRGFLARGPYRGLASQSSSEVERLVLGAG